MRVSATILIGALLTLPLVGITSSYAIPGADAALQSPPPGFPATSAADQFSVPAGHMIQATSGPEGFVLEVIPLPAPGTSPANHERGQQADCENDIPQSAYVTKYGVPHNSNWPLRANRASLGECIPEMHTGPVNFFQFSSQGDWYGWMRIDDVNGMISLGCAPAGNVVGVGIGDMWRTTYEGANMTCFLEKYGVEPSEFTSWEATIYNNHGQFGTVYLSIN